MLSSLQYIHHYLELVYWRQAQAAVLWCPHSWDLQQHVEQTHQYLDLWGITYNSMVRYKDLKLAILVFSPFVTYKQHKHNWDVTKPAKEMETIIFVNTTVICELFVMKIFMKILHVKLSLWAWQATKFNTHKKFIHQKTSCKIKHMKFINKN